jgi:peptidoglycan/xylan/chitin deacetylase (PgdA/CDA1 family)
MKLIVFLSAVFVFLMCAFIYNSTFRRSNAYSNTAKLCALTFDDGPDVRLTPLLLDKLEKHKVVASFFVIGQLVNENTKPVLERAVTLSCEIDNHSWAWDSMSAMTEGEVRDSVDRTSKAIEKYTGKAPKFFRPPNLAVSDTMFETIDLPFASGILGYDWAGCNTSAEDRAQNIIREIRNGAIILLHDVQPEPHPTPEALDILIPELKKQGYTFVTLSELFKKTGTPFKPHQKKMWVYIEK